MHLSLSKASSMAVQSPRQAALLSNDHRRLARACLQVSTMLSTPPSRTQVQLQAWWRLVLAGRLLRAVSIQTAKFCWPQAEAKAVLATEAGAGSDHQTPHAACALERGQ